MGMNEGGWSLARMAELGVKRRPKGQTTTKFFINILDRLVLFPVRLFEKRLASFPALELLVPCSYCTSSFRIINREIQRNLILSYDALIRDPAPWKIQRRINLFAGRGGDYTAERLITFLKRRIIVEKNIFQKRQSTIRSFLFQRLMSLIPTISRIRLFCRLTIYICIRYFNFPLTSNWLKRRKARWEIKRKIFKKGRYFLESIAGSVQLFIKSSPVEKALYLWLSRNWRM